MKEKQCNQCGENKSLDDFYSEEKQSKSRGKYIYYNPKCKACVKLNYDNWRIENPERHNKNNRKYNDSRVGKQVKNKLNTKYRLEGKVKKWQQENMDYLTEYQRNRMINKAHTFSNEEWIRCKEYFDNSCAYCGLNINEHYKSYNGEMKNIDLHKEHVDHNGSNDITNCVPACQSCNSKKWAFEFEDWYSEENPIFSTTRSDKIIKWLNEDCLIDLKEVIT